MFTPRDLLHLPLLLFATSAIFHLSCTEEFLNDGDIAACNISQVENSYIYCYGPILSAVNELKLFNDSKTFVDMPMKADPIDVMRNYTEMFGNKTSNQIGKEAMQNFVDKFFSPAGTELVNCTPSDWLENPPKLLAMIKDPTLQQWALDLNGIWKVLCRQIDPKNQAMIDHPGRYSLIHVPNPFVVPGGRFNEFYYWDAYWIIKGLLACEMHNMTRNMIENLSSMIDLWGFIPNGGRVYYLDRSQPPLLAAMLFEYYEATDDWFFVRQILPSLALRELNFWNTKRSINVTVGNETYTMYQYRVNTNLPRPESYQEDVQRSLLLNDTLNTNQSFFQNLASAAESGMDFSTRWFADKKSIETIEVTNVIPVELNSIICYNYRLFSLFYERLNDTANAAKYQELYLAMKRNVHNLFYNETEGSWFDYNIRTGAHNIDFYPTNAFPLFAGCYDTLDVNIPDRFYDYMVKTGSANYTGIPSSIHPSGEQWDFPNGWAPHNHLIIEGLRKSASPKAQEQAYRLANLWVLENLRVWQHTKFMWEKYDVSGNIPNPGNGGEYDVQLGFGWSNGAILDLLLSYGNRLSVNNTNPTVSTTSATPSVTSELTQAKYQSTSTMQSQSTTTKDTVKLLRSALPVITISLVVTLFSTEIISTNAFTHVLISI